MKPSMFSYYIGNIYGYPSLDNYGFQTFYKTPNMMDFSALASSGVPRIIAETGEIPPINGNPARLMWIELKKQ
ncbi:MAG: hypothetical protein HQK52_23260 [Oligoflexia bacterium]|nr:hypothetical protein [Oligoflexia bacterium]